MKFRDDPVFSGTSRFYFFMIRVPVVRACVMQSRHYAEGKLIFSHARGLQALFYFIFIFSLRKYLKKVICMREQTKCCEH